MVFELKSKNNSTPGVLIFSHKEYKLLFNNDSENRYLKKLKDQYFIGVHWGASEDKIYRNKLVDFHFCLPGLLPKNTIPSSELVNLTTRNFLSREYRTYNSEKYYDIITIGRKVKAKRYLEFFLIIKQVMKVKPDLKVMIIAPEDSNPKKSTFDYLFEENLNEIFTPAEIKNINIFSGKNYLSRNEIIDLLNKSKIFLFTSVREGVAKVTGEAALCGLRILIYKYFRGNATYGIDKKQYSLFEDVEDCALQVLSILGNKELSKYNNKNLYEDEGRAVQIIVDDEVVKKYKPVTLDMEVGDLLIFSPQLFHKSGNNTSNFVRFSFVGQYHSIDSEHFRAPALNFEFSAYFIEKVYPK